MRSGWATRRRNETLRAKERGEDISEREAQLRAGASLHGPSSKLWLWDQEGFPNPRLYDGIEVKLSRWSVTLPNCVPVEPGAVRAQRDFDKMTGQVARMIEEGRAQPEEIRFVCSEFFMFVRNGEHFLVRWGERTKPYRIDKDKVQLSFETRTVTFGNNSEIRNVRVGLFAYYLTLYKRFSDFGDLGPMTKPLDLPMAADRASDTPGSTLPADRLQ